MYYNIHDIIKLESFVNIYELEYFKTDNILKNIDLSIGEDTSEVTYKDLLCSLSIRMEENSYLGISKLLYWSRHVLYVNLIEPLLRMILIPKGYALLHLACLEKDKKGIMISAPPDTGKTSCILKCLKYSNENGTNLSLLSDDMVIVSEDGHILPFPKPFTISSHTLDSVFGIDTDPWYKIRSMVHSKGGRSAYKGMGTVGWMPIMGINAIAQIVFKPPKLYPDKVTSIKIGEKAMPEKLFFLSTEFEGEKDISKKDAVELILSNTDSAYITPPYDKIFPNLSLNSFSYKDLLDREIETTDNLIENVDPIIIGRKDYSWYEYILKDQFQI